MKTLRNLAIVYLLVQIACIAAWIIPGWPLHETAWGLVFLPSFLFFGFGLLGLFGILVVLFSGFIAWSIAENQK